MRQIHAAIEHWQRGDFECAIALASAASEMLPGMNRRTPFRGATKHLARQ
jgi:hypothetical protein